jgi:hypothetical protein
MDDPFQGLGLLPFSCLLLVNFVSQRESMGWTGWFRMCISAWVCSACCLLHGGCFLAYLENQVGLKLNGTHQLLFYADDVYLLVDNIGTIKKKCGNFN